ncbi:MAG: ATPase domain-containing protein [Armatimonadota bacterium]
MAEQEGAAARLSSGIAGYDEILLGGFLPNRAYLIRGGPGTGKTILGMHYLTAGAAKGESSLFISLGEPVEEIRNNAEKLGFNLDGVEFLDLSPTPEFFSEVQAYDIFAPAEVEREPTTKKITDVVERLKPKRVFADSMTQFRYLATDEFQFRKQVLSFLRFLVEQGATVLFTSESSTSQPDDDLQFLADGVTTLEYAPEGRNVSILKYRGSSFRGGQHSFTISEQGIEVFPRLQPVGFRREFAAETIPSGVPELDELLHGGIERGTITLVSGPSGVGKTTVGTQFMKEAAGRGERSVIYAFDESIDTLLTRSENIGIPMHSMMEVGTLGVFQIEPLRFTPDEFANMVRAEVEENNARIVMVDSVSGYRLSLRGEDLTAHLHSLGRYLKNMGVTMLLITEVEHITGEFRITDVGISYLADNVIFLRYLEIAGEIRKAIGVLKKRTSDFEKTLREFVVTRYGVKVGRPLTELRGILRGVPEWVEPKAREG